MIVETTLRFCRQDAYGDIMMGYGARSRQVNFQKISESIVDDQEYDLDEDQSDDPTDDQKTDQVEDRDVDC